MKDREIVKDMDAWNVASIGSKRDGHDLRLNNSTPPPKNIFMILNVIMYIKYFIIAI